MGRYCFFHVLCDPAENSMHRVILCVNVDTGAAVFKVVTLLVRLTLAVCEDSAVHILL